MINNHKAPIKVKDPSNKISDDNSYGERKIQLTLQISFFFLDTGEIRTMDSKSKNIEILMGNETDDIINELFESFKQTYQEGSEKKKWGKASLLLKALIYCIIVFIKQDWLTRGKSCLKSPEWLRNKRATINPQNKKDDKYFQYAITTALNHQNIESHHQRISKIRPFINQYNWKGIQFPSHQEEWKKFEQNNKTIALNVLFVPRNTKTIRLAYKSNYNSQQRESQLVLLMITDGEKWHYLAVKSLSTLFRGITSSHDGDFYCLNCFHSYHTNNALKNMKDYVITMITVM